MCGRMFKTRSEKMMSELESEGEEGKQRERQTDRQRVTSSICLLYFGVNYVLYDRQKK